MNLGALFGTVAVVTFAVPPLDGQESEWPKRFTWWTSIEAEQINDTVFDDAVDRIFEENWDTSSDCTTAKEYATAAVGSTQYYWGVPKDAGNGAQWFGSTVVINDGYQNYGSRNLAAKIVHEA